MTNEYSVHVDWTTQSEQYENLGRNAIVNSCEHKEGVAYKGYCNECDISEDSQYPMMNYAYPLYSEPSEKEILAVVKQTCLTIMKNNETDECFLALCGGGMDLSQSIGLAYLLAGERIPHSLAMEISTQPNLSEYGQDFRKVMNAIKNDLESEANSIKFKMERVEEAIKESLKLDKEKKAKKVSK